MKNKHQHVIPQTYLRKFSHRNDRGTFFINGFDIQTETIKKDLSVKDVCVEKNFYTIKSLGEVHKHLLDDYFRENIENQYSNAYKILVLEKKEKITPEERAVILFTTLSMYFRTPKALNKFAEFIAQMSMYFEGKNTKSEIDFLGYNVSLEDESFKKIKKEVKETHRINYLQTQIHLLGQFIKFRIRDGISVIELVGDNEFITSDNPVDIASSFDASFHLFSDNNAIYVPLDPKHVLFISPPKMEASLDFVSHQRDNNSVHLVVNYSVSKNAERWVLGTENGINLFVEQLDTMSTPADDNHPLVISAKNRVQKVLELQKLLEQGVNNDNKELLQFWKVFKDSPIYLSDIGFQDAYKQLKAAGLEI